MCKAIILYKWPDERKEKQLIQRTTEKGVMAEEKVIVKPYLHWNWCSASAVVVKGKLMMYEAMNNGL